MWDLAWCLTHHRVPAQSALLGCSYIQLTPSTPRLGSPSSFPPFRHLPPNPPSRMCFGHLANHKSPPQCALIAKHTPHTASFP